MNLAILGILVLAAIVATIVRARMRDAAFHRALEAERKADREYRRRRESFSGWPFPPKDGEP